MQNINPHHRQGILINSGMDIPPVLQTTRGMNYRIDLREELLAVRNSSSLKPEGATSGFSFINGGMNLFQLFLN